MRQVEQDDFSDLENFRVEPLEPLEPLSESKSQVPQDNHKQLRTNLSGHESRLYGVWRFLQNTFKVETDATDKAVTPLMGPIMNKKEI